MKQSPFILPAHVQLSCPLCQARVRTAGDRLICEAGHEAGRIEDGLADLRSPKAGIERELVDFWSRSPEYYAEAREANLDYGDAGHASHRRVIEELLARGARTVLDVGCGTGEVAEVLGKKEAIRYVGVDVSPLAPRIAASLGRPGTFLAADAERLPFADGSFDAAITLYALEHFAHPREAISEIVRVVRPGGTVAILSLAYDRPLGIVPSIRFGLAGRARRNPLNIAGYAVNRGRFAVRQAWKQVRMLADSSHTPFELVERPLVLDGSYSADLDAVHVVSPRAVVRLVGQLGCDVVETSLPAGVRGWLRAPFDFSMIARKRA